MRTIRIWAALAILVLGAGCWNRVELNEVAVVSATGIDWQDDHWVLSYQIVIPKEIMNQVGGTGQAAFNVFSTSGDNFRTAISKASQETSRRLYFSHNQIVIIGQAAARQGLAAVMEAYMRNHDSRETVSVFLSKGTARRIMEQFIPLEQIPGAAIQRLIANDEMNSSNFRQMTVHNVMVDLLGSSQATGIPGLTIAGEGAGTDRMDSLNQSSMPSKVRLHELGLVRGDKLVGWLNDEQSRGVMWLADHVHRATIPFACSDEEEEKGRRGSSARILNASSQRKPVWENGKWRMDIEVEAEGTLLEFNCKGDLADPAVVEGIERHIEREIQSIMEEGWRALRKHNADVAGFGTVIHKRYPRQWKTSSASWEELFPKTEVRIQATMRLNTTGMSVQDFKQVQEEARQ